MKDDGRGAQASGETGDGDDGTPAQFGRPKPVSRARRRRDRLMLLGGVTLGLAFFALLTSIGR